MREKPASRPMRRHRDKTGLIVDAIPDFEEVVASWHSLEGPRSSHASAIAGCAYSVRGLVGISIRGVCRHAASISRGKRTIYRSRRQLQRRRVGGHRLVFTCRRPVRMALLEGRIR